MLDKLNKAQKSRLQRHVCWLCEQRLDRTLRGGCCGIGSRCSQEINEDRAKRCLNASKHQHIKFEDTPS